MPANFNFLGGLFGNAGDGAGEAQAGIQGGAGGNGGAGPIQQQQAAAQEHANIQVRFNDNPWNGQPVQFGNQYNYVIRNDNGFGNFVEYHAAPVFRPARPRQVDAIEAVQNMANSFLNEGYECSEIVVSRNTMRRIQERFVGMMRFDANGNIVPNDENVMVLNTANGPIRFVCAEDKPKFDLAKYMETVE